MEAKRIFFVLLILLTTLCVMAQQGKKTIISLYVPQLINKTASAELQLQQFNNLEKSVSKLRIPVRNGEAKSIFNLDEPRNFGLVFCGKVLFLPPLFDALIEPGDSLHVVVTDTLKTGLSDLIITGSGKEKFDLLKYVYNRYFEVCSTLKPPTQTTIEEHYQWTDTLITVVDSCFQSKRSTVKPFIFEVLHAQAIDKIIELVLLRSLKTSQEHSTASAFKKYVIDKNIVKRFTNPGLIKHMPYSHKVLTYIALLDYGIRQKIPVNTLSVSLTPECYNAISSFYSDNPEIKNYLLAERLVMYLQISPFDNSMEEVYKTFSREMPRSELYRQVVDRYDFTKKTKSIGRPFYNFRLQDTSKNEVSLTDFRGKKVLLDFWFSGCQPCKLFVPTLTELAKRYKNKNLVFLSISIDNSFDIWKSNVNQYSIPEAIHLYTNGQGKNHPLINAASILVYPTLILVDEEGNVELTNMLTHQPEDIFKVLDKAILSK
uniref:TlpA family protein disulfide reductase n=1 Tax=Pedobacter schmidteae TaxID=2201271 RepID=UPI000EB04BD7|nr:TlpA disulfide reductase family protein [Pedobacter schmidteae]